MKSLKENYSEFETIDLGKVIGGTAQQIDTTLKPAPAPAPPPEPEWWEFWK